MFRLTYPLAQAIAISLLAAIIFLIPVSFADAASKTSALSANDLQRAYDKAQAGGEKVRILVVPGHEPFYGGAEYAGYYERELVLPLAERIAEELGEDTAFEVILARDADGWSPALEKYFKKTRTIQKWVTAEKRKTRNARRAKANEGQVAHNTAPEDVALRLYGINKWANENDVDLMIHVHLNDAGGRAPGMPGAYTGFTIYTPDTVYKNARTSAGVAGGLLKELSSVAGISTHPLESSGIVKDRDLIAIGANNTARMPSVLVEYGYLYEPQFLNDASRDDAFADYATATAEGVRAFFDK